MTIAFPIAAFGESSCAAVFKPAAEAGLRSGNLSAIFARVRGEAELVTFFEHVADRGELDPAVWTSLKQLDVLAPVRAELAAGRALPLLDQALRAHADPKFRPMPAWQTILDAYQIARDPSLASEVAMRLVEAKERGGANKFITNDYRTGYGAYLSRTLFVSLWSLPPAARADVMARLLVAIDGIEAQVAADAAAGRFVNDQEKMIAKYPRRNAEYVLSILMYPEFVKLREQIKTRGYSIEAIDSFLAPLKHGERGGYGFAKVVAVAKAMHEALRPALSDGEFIEIFGSFVGGKAKLASSDVDVLFSTELNELYKQQVGFKSAVGVEPVREVHYWMRTYDKDKSAFMIRLFMDAEARVAKLLERDSAGAVGEEIISPSVFDGVGTANFENHRAFLVTYSLLGIRLYRDGPKLILHDPFATADGIDLEISIAR